MRRKAGRPADPGRHLKVHEQMRPGKFPWFRLLIDVASVSLIVFGSISLLQTGPFWNKKVPKEDQTGETRGGT